MTLPLNDPWADYRAGSTEPWSVNLMCALIQAKRPQILIETGTFEGRTTMKFVEAMETYGWLQMSLLFTVEADPQRAEALEPVLRPLGTQYHNSLMLMMEEALHFLQRQKDHSADFIFLDDDHTADHVDAELTEVQRILRPGGICCVHDVVGAFGLDAVVRAHGGLILDLPRLHAAGGLGLLTA